MSWKSLWKASESCGIPWLTNSRYVGRTLLSAKSVRCMNSYSSARPESSTEESQKQRTGVSAPHVRQKPFSRLSLLHENVSRIFSGDDSDDFESELVEVDSGE